MSRLSYVDAARLSQEQKELYDSIAAGPRAAKRASLVDAEGHLTGPFNAFLHLPALGKHWSAIGEGLRFRTNLDRGLFELAILIIAVHWRSGHEWAAHARLAREAGIDQAVIDTGVTMITPEYIRKHWPAAGFEVRAVAEGIAHGQDLAVLGRL